MNIPELVIAFRDRTVGTRIRGQQVESVELCIDTNGANGSLRYLLHVFFVEPAGIAELPEHERLLRRVFWDTDFAVANLAQDELVSVLDGSAPLLDARWTLSDELRALD